MMYRTNNRFAAQAAAVQAVEEAKASPLPHRQRMLFNSKETWQLTGRKIRNQRVHCQGISATKAKTTKITETIAKIEAAIVEDLAVIAEDELAPRQLRSSRLD
jgi:hypothetical protein